MERFRFRHDACAQQSHAAFSSTNNARVWFGPLAVCLYLLSCCSGCATLLSERRYPVTIDNPPGPTYFSVVDHKQNVIHQGVTPQQVTLDAKRFPFIPAKYGVVFAGAGNTSQTREIKAKPDPWIVGNLLVGGVPGVIVDGASGAMYKLPKKVEGFVPTTATVTDASQGAVIANAVARSGVKGDTTTNVLLDANPAVQPSTDPGQFVVSEQLSDQVPVRTASAVGDENINR
ncbi:hypothetical protein [Rhodopirellula sp. MGV]|uniref:hypothetical protein n=1 Tax=Rhodopirellula sp. MGV TaxID=2023130 RepID=UPI000B9754EA|nr:hypothetical protein [Rhodopirellula sp. MGV]OYP37900.1 hypothetical protein CGZ80_04015 [Rhodopirellula sp. MGV]PNY37077.1 hypothetical protein C2E31_09525 [Rhodopirellula baltica]